MNKLTELVTKIHIHPLFWVIVALSVATAQFYELCVLFFVVFVHELGHSVAALYYSWRIKKISILPFGGVAEMDEHGNRPLKEEAIVILAGPIQHVWILIASFLLFHTSLIAESTFQLLLQCNLMILLFNLLPIWPLDGGKLLLLWLSLTKPFSRALALTIQVSLVGLILFTIIMTFTAPTNLNVWMIIGFLVFSLYFERKQQRYVFMRFLLERYYGKKDTPRELVPLTVDQDDLVVDVLERFQRGCKHPIMIEVEGKNTGVLDENELLHAYFSEQLLSAKVRDLLYPF